MLYEQQTINGFITVVYYAESRQSIQKYVFILCLIYSLGQKQILCRKSIKLYNPNAKYTQPGKERYTVGGMAVQHAGKKLLY
jgi:hypothetical protein